MNARLGRLAVVIGLCASILAPATNASAIGVTIPGLDGGNCGGTIQDPWNNFGTIQAHGVVDCNRNYTTIAIHTCIQLLVPTLPDRGLFVQGPTCGFKHKEGDDHIEVTGRMPIPCVPGVYHATVEGVTTKGVFPNQSYGPHVFEFSNVVLITCGIEDNTGAEEQQSAPAADESSESSEAQSEAPAEEETAQPAGEPAESEAPAEEAPAEEAPAEEAPAEESTEPEAAPEESSEDESSETESSEPQPEESPQP